MNASFNSGAACPTPNRTSPLGGQIGKEKFTAVPFAFTIQGGVYTESFRIPASHNFKLVIINAYYEREFYLQIRDDFRGEDLFIAPVRASLITGDGRLPFVLPKEYEFNAGTTITVAVQDIDPSATAPATVEIVLIGYKIY